MPTLKVSGIHFTLIGDFNPAIFQPAWFSSEKLISQSEASAATEVVVTAQLTNFTLPWARLSINQTNFLASSLQESHFETLRDLVVGTFTLLKHTPIGHLGINTEQHYQYEDEESWNNFGHKLAPKPIWNKFMQDPGMVSMAMTEKATNPGRGILRVDVQSSNRIKTGIFFGTNRHFVIADKMNGVAEVLNMIDSNFENVLAESKQIAESLMTSL